MNQITNTLKNINFKKILIIYIIFQPIIDLLTSLCVRFISPSFTLGIFIRGLFLIFTLIYSLIISEKKWRKRILIYFSILIIYIILFFINAFLNTGFSLMLYQLKTIFKIFYFVVLLISLVPIMKNIDINNKYLIYSLFGYTSVIFLTTICGIAFNSYADGSAPGKNGLFYAANEIGTILCILMPFLLLNLINNKFINNNKKNMYNTTFEIITLIFVVFSSLWMGTKVPFIGLILSLIVAFFICVINIIKKEDIKLYFCKIVAIILLGLIIAGTIRYSPIGHNLGISIDKLNKISNSYNELNNTIEKPDIPKAESVVLSNRDLFYDNTLKEYKSSSIVSKLIGIGFLQSQNDQIVPRKNIEIDYFDILFSNGIIGFIIYFTPIAIALFYIVKLILDKKYMIFENNIIFYMYSIFIVLAIARLAGHMFTAPAVNIYLAITINKLISVLKD